MADPQIVWLRRDLRLADQPAVTCAAAAGPVIPVYVLDEDRAGDREAGGASRWWLHHSLGSLQKSLGRHRLRLILRRGNCVEQLRRLAGETGANTIHALRHYEPWWIEAEMTLAKHLDLCLHDGNYLAPPGSVTTGQGNGYKIYTPFAKALMQHMPPAEPLSEPRLSLPDRWPDSDRLKDWNLLPADPDWAGEIRDFWAVGEAAAHDRLEEFEEAIAAYEEDRNRPSVEGTSRLSPHLHHGEISPRQVWHALSRHRGKGAETFRGELAWRDFAQNLIWQFPRYPEESYRGEFGTSLWRNPDRGHLIAEDLRAWQRGCTGYPIVDAGMRQLWAIGWIHNRVRMIAASFLVKHLLIDWRIGERWFWDTLVDADYANNGCNWQWVAGTGVDSSMFVRIMAPLSQSEKFDAGEYIRRWVPELAGLADKDIHDPPDEVRADHYPARIVGHREARERTLDAYRAIKR